MNNNYKKYCDIFKNTLLLDDNDELKNASFDVTQGWNSFAHMELIVNIEMEFDVKMTSEDVMAFHSFKDGIDILRRKGVEIGEE